MSITVDGYASVARRAFTSAVFLTAMMVGVGLMVFPAALSEWKNTFPGLAGVGVMLGAYALISEWGAVRFEQIDRRLLRISAAFGLVGAAIYATEIVLEYALLPEDNSQYGYFEFGLVFLSYLIAGFIAGLFTRHARNGLLAAFGAALVSTLLWYCVLLAVTYLMKGTPRQMDVFRAEGNLEDFKHSGSTNFEAWLIQDLLGAGFYHMLLGPVFASGLGFVGGSLGRFFARRPPHRPTAVAST